MECLNIFYPLKVNDLIEKEELKKVGIRTFIHAKKDVAILLANKSSEIFNSQVQKV